MRRAQRSSIPCVVGGSVLHRRHLDNAIRKALGGIAERLFDTTRLYSARRSIYDSPLMVENDPSERRRHPRGPIELKVEYKRVNTFFADFTKNISKGGTFIKTTKPLDIGTEFLFKLYVPALDQPLELRGSVQWIVTPEAADGSEPPGMGIAFIYESPEHKAEINGKVEKLMIESLGYHLYAKLVEQANGGSKPDDEK
jgi:type IV pilus assembly protein PilZ